MNQETYNLAELKKDKDYGRFDFVGRWQIFCLGSIIVAFGFVAMMSIKGFNYGIDFAGGAEVQVKFQKPVEVSELRQFAEEIGYGSASIQSFGEDNEYLIRTELREAKTDKQTNAETENAIKAISAGLTTKFASAGPEIRRVDAVGPQVGDELKKNSLLAIFYSLILILIYVSIRFDYKYAPAAVVGLFYDAIMTLGIYSLLGKEVNLQTMAAILTIIGYSLNDTIVNFDRIRENLPLYKKKPLPLIINKSVNETFSRTILTSFTALMAVGAMYFLGSGVIKDLSFALGVGFIIGVYSTLYICSPIVIISDKIQRRFETGV